ncbi:MAG: four-carbon acid sugar kinase family protein [Mobilicoccus sp.]|nr:four-carbon acid sugar kinase family protein [Mobilicoccus sp.]
MAQILVVADDLTGGNACAAGFARAGLRAVTVGRGRGGRHPVAEYGEAFDVVVTTTDSRHSPPEEARAVITEAVEAGAGARLVTARIDTTLRGNVGVAAQAVLEAVRARAAGRVVGVCAPAHPDAGRVTVDGDQLLYGRRLEDTELAHDVRSPMTTSSVAAALRAGTSLRVAGVPLSVVTGPSGNLIGAVRDALADDIDVLVGDAFTVEHLDRLAAAVVTAAPEVTWCGIDPGPFSLALSRVLGIRGRGQAAPRLVISGSATELTRDQLQRLASERPVDVVRPVLDGDRLPEVDATAAAVVDAVGAADEDTIVVLATVLDADDIVDLPPGAAEELPLRLGRIADAVLAESEVGGLFTTGGDVTAAVIGALAGGGIDVQDEIIPLAVAGHLVDGDHAGMPIVTKGGLIGDARTTVRCLDHLRDMVTQRARSVHHAHMSGDTS